MDKQNAGSVKKHKILVVDDSEMNRALLSEMLSDDFEIIEACDGVEALKILRESLAELSVVLLDIVMPRADGFEVLVAMNKYRWLETLPVIMISAETGSTSVRKAYELGVVDFIPRPFDTVVVRHRVSNTIALFDRQKRLAALAADQIYERAKSNRLMVNILSHVVERRNGESGLHVLNIGLMTELLAESLVSKTDKYPMSHEDIVTLCSAAAIHDIGKIGIPEQILNKSGRLTPEEYDVMKTHSMIGAEMIAEVPVYQDEPLVKMSYEVCRWHHERWDGTGYPDGLVGDAIPITAQIVSLADVYDALTSERVYKKAFSHEEAIRMIVDGECGRFNPLLLECLLSEQDKLREKLQQGALEQQEAYDLQNVMDEVLRSGEISSTESTLRLLEYERTKLQFYNLTSDDIQFEQMLSPSMLMLSERDAGRLGLNTVTMDPFQNEKYLSIIGKENLDELSRLFGRTTQENPVMQLECKLNVSGEEHWYRIICRTLWDGAEPAHCVGVIGKIVDIHRERGHMADIKRLASRDALTDLMLWSHARKQIQQELEEHPDNTFTAVLMDLDSFQAANDLYGHIFGDHVLKYVAEQLKTAMPHDAVISRIGGDEFLVFVRCDGNLKDLVNDIYTALSNVYEGFSVSVSMGLVLRQGGDRENSDTLIKHAVQALYVGKRKGRGQYCIYDDTLPEPFSVLSPIESDRDEEDVTGKEKHKA